LYTKVAESKKEIHIYAEARLQIRSGQATCRLHESCCKVSISEADAKKMAYQWSVLGHKLQVTSLECSSSMQETVNNQMLTI
jgi:hypothetical protein